MAYPSRGEASRLVELLVGHVDADDLPGGSDAARRDEGVHARTAAQVDDQITRGQRGEAEVVAHAREGLDRLGGSPVELRSRVPEPERQLAPHLEVERPLRLGGHRPVHGLHLVAELAHVHACHRTPPCGSDAVPASSPSGTGVSSVHLII